MADNLQSCTTSESVQPSTNCTVEAQPNQPAATTEADRNFICGVVEGFYGRPWTTEQRKDLFGKLKRWGMESYVYAPKDDYKHRAYWRELYTVEEGDHLTSLIAAAKEHDIIFYYALSPGLDMTYSNPKEIVALKRKLEQVNQFGCDAFALLFDDIESEMTKADKEVFQTFAHAQVTVTNEIYNHLNCSRFLFCPTQYCGTRAVPTVSNSEYLLTLGSKLALDIDILWTGPKVISKELTIELIQEVTEVLRRPPVIWDNLHANDYDQKRVFLGPYSGRSPELIPLLRGVLTNPNCEFHANAIAIHTLAHWSKCSTDTKINTSLSADIKLETEQEDGVYGEEAPVCLSKNVYHPRVALRNAIAEWLPEFFLSKKSFGPITKPHPAVTMVMPVIPIMPSVNTCMSLTTTTTSTSTNTTAMKVAEVNTTQLQALAEVCSVVTGTENIQLPNIVMNSLVSSTTIVTTSETLLSNTVAQTLPFPTISVPVSSIGIPILNVKGTDYKLNDTVDQITTDDDEAETLKKREDEAMPCEPDITVADGTNNKTTNSLNGSDAVMTDDSAAVAIATDRAEPMECASSSSVASPKHTPKLSLDDVVMAENVSTSSTGSMQVECSDTSIQSADMTCGEATTAAAPPPPPPQTAAAANDVLNDSNSFRVTSEDISLLCDLFYLPFEHGNRAMQLLNEFNWLKSNAVVLVGSGGSDKHKNDSTTAKPEVHEWYQRSERFYQLSHLVIVLAKKLASCDNRELCYEMFSYVWDIAGVVTLLTGFVKWLALGYFPVTINSYTQGSYTWFSKGWRETFTSGDQEPWVFRGGLTADLQRLIPVDSGNDLFLYKLPDVPSTSFPIIRPYTNADEKQIYAICHKTCRDGSDCTELFPSHLQSIPADRLIGPFVTINPELCLLVEDVTTVNDTSNNEIIGYACAALDAKLFYRNQEMCWMPAMCEKYPLALLDEPESLTQTAMDSINHFHHFKYDCPQDVLGTHPSIMTCCVLKENFIVDQSMAKRLVTVLLAALRSNGSSGVHACINNTDRYLHQFYTKLGFVEVYQEPNGKVYMGRNF